MIKEIQKAALSSLRGEFRRWNVTIVFRDKQKENVKIFCLNEEDAMLEYEKAKKRDYVKENLLGVAILEAKKIVDIFIFGR